MKRHALIGRFAAVAAVLLMPAISMPAMAQKAITLNDQQAEDIVRRSYQYVAMFNVIQKQIATKGLNKPVAKTELLDHTMQGIARLHHGPIMTRSIRPVHTPQRLRLPR